MATHIAQEALHGKIARAMRAQKGDPSPARATNEELAHEFTRRLRPKFRMVLGIDEHGRQIQGTVS